MFEYSCHDGGYFSPTIDSCTPGGLPKWHSTWLRDPSHPEPPRPRRSPEVYGDIPPCLRLQHGTEGSTGTACLSGSGHHHGASIRATILTTGPSVRLDAVDKDLRHQAEDVHFFEEGVWPLRPSHAGTPN